MPVPDMVTNAVDRSGPPKHTLVTRMSGSGMHEIVRSHQRIAVALGVEDDDLTGCEIPALDPAAAVAHDRRFAA